MFDFPRWKVWFVSLLILAGVLLAVPSLLSKEQVERWPDWLPSARINLGLDIAGGSQLLLEADVSDAAKQRLQAKEDEVLLEVVADVLGIERCPRKGPVCHGQGAQGFAR